MWLYHRVVSPNDADGMANSVDPDQTDLGLHCLPRHISVQKLRVITLNPNIEFIMVNIMKLENNIINIASPL